MFSDDGPHIAIVFVGNPFSVIIVGGIPVLNLKLIEEEYKELQYAFGNRDMVEIADACADLKWVIEGLEHTLKIPQQAVWDEVARSNLAKIDSVTGKVIKREDGKVLKPDGWTPPDIASILRK